MKIRIVINSFLVLVFGAMLSFSFSSSACATNELDDRILADVDCLLFPGTTQKRCNAKLGECCNAKLATSCPLPEIG